MHKILIEDIEFEPNKTLHYSFDDCIEELNCNLKAELDLKSIGGFVEVTGSAKGKMNLTCDRCLNEFEYNLDIDIEWVRTEKEETAERINDLLVRELAQKGKSCRICRQPMPLDSHFRICLKCANKIRRNRQKRG